MSESSEFSYNVTSSEPFTSIREELGLQPLNIDWLRAKAGSQDPQKAAEAIRKLRILWEVEPGRDAKNARTENLLEQFERFSEDERRLILTNLVGLQLTEGCNGGCYFCLFGTKKGVTAKYSFSSIKAFFEKYGEIVNPNMTLYWDSDPFDYRDIDEQGNLRTFVDVYQVFREKQPETYHFVSTSIPKGGGDDFIKFMLYAFEEDRLRKQAGKNPVLTVRISWGKHNIQRVEASILRLTNILINNGYSKKEIDDFFSRCLTHINRFEENIDKIGPLINQHDDFAELDTRACRDGVLIKPSSIEAVMMTAPTIYEPSGQKSIPLSPGEIDSIPSLLAIENYEGYHFKDSLKKRLEYRQIIIPPIKKAIDPSQRLTLPNQAEDIILTLGRESFALSQLRDDFADFLNYYYRYLPKIDLSDGAVFFKTAANIFRERQIYTQQQIERAEQYLSNNPQEAERIKYYILLTEVYLAEMDLLATLIEKNFFITNITLIAESLKNIGKDEATQLPTCIKTLITISEIASDDKLTEEEKRERINELSLQAQPVLSKLFDITDEDWWKILF
jgi:hypothetical protein